ncbi:oxidoreductase domain-containing protein [Biscogniauxia marginata]|nr:oxidoreductase domain-containing protein [Biscogniauxia marginata]
MPGYRTDTSLPVKPIYRSNDVDIPDDFLISAVDDSKPITFTQIDFENSVLPEYTGAFAVVLDHVLSPSECAKLIAMAEDSVTEEDKLDGSPWRPALVHVGGGYEVLSPNYRASDRIIWDNQEIVDRLWARLQTVPHIKEKLISLSTADLLGGSRNDPSTLDFYRVNKRMRFLKYGEDQFFRPHCDSSYGEAVEDGGFVQTWFTLHLYLNDSQQAVGEEADLVGGATSFLSVDESRKMDVDPKAGRVLIFQHMRLRHSGDDVMIGTKYTVRTDIMYRQRSDSVRHSSGRGLYPR